MPSVVYGYIELVPTTVFSIAFYSFTPNIQDPQNAHASMLTLSKTNGKYNHGFQKVDVGCGSVLRKYEPIASLYILVVVVHLGGTVWAQVSHIFVSWGVGIGSREQPHRHNINMQPNSKLCFFFCEKYSRGLISFS